MRLRMLATLALFVWIPAAQATTMVWFEAQPVTGPTYGASYGPGQMTRLGCDFFASPGPPYACSWQVSMKAALGAGGIVEWSLDLLTAPGNGVSLTNPQIAPGNPFNIAPSPGTAGTGPSLLQSAHGTTFTPVQPQTLTLLTFNLTWTWQGSHAAAVFGGPSANPDWVWVNDTTADYEIVQFGSNPAAPAYEGTVGAAPLIYLFHIPEPSSLTLLAIGGVVCLRRRRTFG